MAARNPTRSILLPFTISPEGGIAYTEDRVRQAVQQIISIVGTNPGERVMRPTYGTALARALFEPDDELSHADIRASLQVSLSRWAPGIVIVGIEPESSSYQDGIVQFKISFTLPGSTDLHTATVDVGGTVTEQTFTQ